MVSCCVPIEVDGPSEGLHARSGDALCPLSASYEAPSPSPTFTPTSIPNNLSREETMVVQNLNRNDELTRIRAELSELNASMQISNSQDLAHQVFSERPHRSQFLISETNPPRRQEIAIPHPSHVLNFEDRIPLPGPTAARKVLVEISRLNGTVSALNSGNTSTNTTSNSTSTTSPSPSNSGIHVMTTNALSTWKPVLPCPPTALSPLAISPLFLNPVRPPMNGDQ